MEGLRNGLNVFTAMLLLVATSTSMQMPLADALANLVIIALFAAVYFLGERHVDEWPVLLRHTWTLALTVLWIGDMFIAPVGVYLVFTLFFVYLQALDELQGVVSVVFATCVCIIMQIPGGLTFGGIMGPAISAAISLAIFFAFAQMERISTERQQLITQLMETREELAHTQHEAGAVAERQRLAHELHDTVAQGLSSIQMLLHAAERELGKDPAQLDAAVTRIQQARFAASENLAEARAMIAALQPASLSESSLVDALERMTRSFAAAGEVRIDVETDGDAVELPMKIEATLLRVAQGAVGNVVKHAGATRCRVTLTYSPGEVRLDVVDNGRGFDAAALPPDRAGLGHVGIAAMRQRVAEHGGELVIESAPGGPTAVSVALALPQPS
ncbi:signal transduction histidine kinase [Corynebacterium uterequi]|uniref:Signal transduction histidine kinase n=2 Tax=Corynebacterium uterequi TaxID=1072256 RepID=A0A0G3HJM5_9CORY|nr:signal transduction histidine kinase [Corynebacterium uterequi]